MNNRPRITATLAPWSKLATPDGGWTGKVTKKGMQFALTSEKHRSVEFSAHATPFQQGGYFFIDYFDEALIELRYNNDRDVMLIEVSIDGIKVR
jgi:hypothetical protein